ncbi:hypothetical protein CYMTET_11432 [Cymbomonas tetramitiformis]|uniref:Mixed lineage kinase domain-containing protein n=1 Tax=Cymbomonas tetramitiformis TaxID=36881 RepID=A0AAE0LDG9_9CHLO|nr:hypothetical protein CYMTET_11432 [Cymbomonas tetramitiformis]
MQHLLQTAHLAAGDPIQYAASIVQLVMTVQTTALQVCQNREDCNKLSLFIGRVALVLEELQHQLKTGSRQPSPAIRRVLDGVCSAVMNAGELVESCRSSSSIWAVLSITSRREKFVGICNELSFALQGLSAAGLTLTHCIQEEVGDLRKQLNAAQFEIDGKLDVLRSQIQELKVEALRESSETKALLRRMMELLETRTGSESDPSANPGNEEVQQFLQQEISRMRLELESEKAISAAAEPQDLIEQDVCAIDLETTSWKVPAHFFCPNTLEHGICGRLKYGNVSQERHASKVLGCNTSHEYAVGEQCDGGNVPHDELMEREGVLTASQCGNQCFTDDAPDTVGVLSLSSASSPPANIVSRTGIGSTGSPVSPTSPASNTLCIYSTSSPSKVWRRIPSPHFRRQILPHATSPRSNSCSISKCTETVACSKSSEEYHYNPHDYNWLKDIADYSDDVETIVFGDSVSEPGAALAAAFSHSEEGEEENVSEHGTGKRHAGQGVRGRVPVEANACNKRAKTYHVDEHDTMVLDSDSAVAEMEIDAAPEAVQEMEKGKMVEQENPSAARKRFLPPAPRWRHHSRTRTSCRDGDSRIPERIWCAHCQARDPSVWRVKLDGIAQCEMQLKSLLQRSPAIHHTRLEYSQDFVFCRNPELYENWEKKLAVLVRHAAKMAAVSKWLPQAVDAGGVMNVEMEP